MITRGAFYSVLLVLLGVTLLSGSSLLAVEHRYDDSWGNQGLSLTRESTSVLELSFSITDWSTGQLDHEGQLLQTVHLPGAMLPNNAGAPDLPGIGQYLAVSAGAQVSFRILDSRTETLTGVDLAPAPRIPRETEDGPLHYEKDLQIYHRDAFYPASPVLVSDPCRVRGVDAVILGITPFQYNPVSKELVVFRDLRLEVTFSGGSGRFGEDRLRSRWWDPILRDIFLNHDSLGVVDYNRPPGSRTEDYEYIIICQDQPDFMAWADTLRRWRSEQGIRSGVVTISEIGGNTTSAIESYINNAYLNWDIPPAAVLLLGDYGTGSSGIISPIWNSYCLSDNIYADVDGDNLPEIALARITAEDASDLQTMIGKMLAYERQPPTDPGFYSNMVVAGGWQTERWFILCDEVLAGYFTNVHGKTPVREYAIYSGTPGSTWSTNPNTPTVVGYFGPSPGLGYIPDTPSYLTDWGGNATRLNADLNAGAFILQHRDHGATDGWSEPYYVTSHLSGLSNDELTFVFSINCLTGQYDIAGECFAEAFHRHAQGALGIIAASEISYSFVNDTYVWGMYDYMWPDFDPGYGVTVPARVRPAFGNASGKYYLQASSWPYNPGDKTVTHHLFHHHGDAFMTVYSDLPQNLTVMHDPVLLSGVTSFTVTADAGSHIGLSVDGELLGSAAGTGGPVAIPIPAQLPGVDLLVTVTKQNYYRYSQAVPVVPPTGPFLVYESHVVDDSAGNNDGLVDEGEVIGLDITLENVGSEPATGITAVLSTTDPYVTVLVDTRGFPDIPASGFGTSTEPYSIQVAGDVPDQHEILLTLDVTAAEATWDAFFSLTVQAPVLAAGQLEVNDMSGGNGSGNADAGETFYLRVELENSGHSDADNLTGTLSCTHADVIIHDADGSCLNVPAGGSDDLRTFEAEVLPTCPEPELIEFHLDITAPNGFAASLDFDLPVGGWFDDMEQDRGWTVGAPDDDAATGIWTRVDPIGTEYSGYVIQMEDDHTPAPGTLCFVTGNGSVGGAAGENDVDGGKTTLLTPVFQLGGALSAQVSYYRWYTNSWGNNPDEDWWDVDVTNDGVNWVSLEHTQTTLAAWTQFTFELTDYITLTDQVQLRFVAADEGAGGSLVEAGVDDFLLTVFMPVQTGVGDGVVGLPTELRLGTNYPNPFNPQTTISFELPRTSRVELSVYDLTGRRVVTLVDGELEGGRHEVTWQGRDARGRQVASGLYFSYLKADDEVMTRKMVLLK